MQIHEGYCVHEQNMSLFYPFVSFVLKTAQERRYVSCNWGAQ
jgi:hypothetical protein